MIHLTALVGSMAENALICWRHPIFSYCPVGQDFRPRPRRDPQDPLEQGPRPLVVAFEHRGPNLQPARDLIDNFTVKLLEVGALGDQPADCLATGSKLASDRDTGICESSH